MDEATWESADEIWFQFPTFCHKAKLQERGVVLQNWTQVESQLAQR